MSEAPFSSSQLIHAGFNQLSQAITNGERLQRILEDAYAQGMECTWGLEDFLHAATVSDSPDSALWHLTEIAHKVLTSAISAPAEEHDAPQAVARQLFEASADGLARLIRVCGASEFCGRLLTSDGEFLPEVLESSQPRIPFEIDFSQPYAQQIQDMRKTYWRNILHIIADDVTSSAPLDIQPVISRRLSELIDTTLQAALSIAQHKVPQGHACKFAVFAMGKLGAQEINYISDVDLVYIVDKTDEFRGDLISLGTHIGSVLQTVCSAIVPGVTMPALWDIDTALRPEGKAGALVRTVDSAKSYYDNWAENWEFQALLKARFVAGDAELGHAYMSMITPLIWSASARKNFVYDCRAMRTRVENLIPLDQRNREIKLGKGGLRDVEFTVQMLQLVHGRTDESLRTKNTLSALKQLAHGGYMNRTQAQDLSHDYRFLRVLEHRQQLFQMRRTHLFPKISGQDDDIFVHSRHINDRELADNLPIVRLSRALSLTPVQLVEHFDAVRRQVRQLHMDIYYRPMLPNISQLSEGDITLSEDALRARFESVGFADPYAAIRHVTALTSGISRASRINRILLPTILLWIGNGQNPDMGLMMWRRWVETIGGSGPYLGFLRDSPTALQRLCHILSNSRYLSEALMISSESTTWLGDDEALNARSYESLRTRTNVLVHRFAHSQEEFSTLLRALRRREIERIGLGWMSSVISSEQALRGMTRVYDVLIDATMQWCATRLCEEEERDTPPSRVSVIAMGRYGGEEVNFSSDADVIAVYEVCEGCSDEEARKFAQRHIELMRTVLTGFSATGQSIDIDMDLRPEGKNGPLVRSLESYKQYYASWAETWERQALLRARFAAGDVQLGERFIHEVVNPVRYSSQALSQEAIHSIRKLKARMEAERLPRGVRYDRHIKLGRGGLSDVEWTVQLLQLQHAYEWEDVRSTHTLSTIDALEKHGALSAHDAAILRSTWTLCTDLRNASFLWSGRAAQADIIPDDYFDMGGLAVYLGHEAHKGLQFLDDVIGQMRKCREVVNRVFYESE
ncbi:bifunctional [glutamine synthetase] adenylyltransferase/[glutamine synthetase]-adenylyl-L-tyrosine phosphorylase [Alloscardovia criceti]|uniref:bifunctional [glutamine synthetase] adenylyltransferase/[glutamine synthetase]-adenylyl-L-tyrosine phosphorylase n=1 Tax=Alloscardovia criceti TaxID=356828 RepID=UPI0003623820|nr:bifunctional [glutamine synthetase] adenylyltransferase/[glutamine synthetase]-adenylyl-L-tyrosine phosphorylase [Alloscardovia criceti]